MDFRTDVVVRISGYVPNIESGKKCQHGVYIASTKRHGAEVIHDSPTFSDKCGVCVDLIAYLEKTGKALEEVEQHVKYLWNRLEEKQDGRFKNGDS